MVKLFGLSGGLALGYFAAGCAPGGGSSNMYTYLLGGDVSLSVTMTLISIIASLGMIPLWLFTLGRILTTDDMRINIPFFNIIIMLVCYIIPVLIGLLIQRYAKRLSSAIVRCLRPVYVVFIIFMFTFGVWTNLYVFRLMRPLLLLAGCLLPYVGFALSGLVAFILRQPPPRVLTIAIETGIQNTGVPIILMKFSLAQPDADLSIIAPIVIAMFMPLPLWIAFAVVTIRRRCQRHRKSAMEPAVPLKGAVTTTVSEDGSVHRNDNLVNTATPCSNGAAAHDASFVEYSSLMTSHAVNSNGAVALPNDIPAHT